MEGQNERCPGKDVDTYRCEYCPSSNTQQLLANEIEELHVLLICCLLVICGYQDNSGDSTCHQTGCLALCRNLSIKSRWEGTLLLSGIRSVIIGLNRPFVINNCKRQTEVCFRAATAMIWYHPIYLNIDLPFFFLKFYPKWAIDAYPWPKNLHLYSWAYLILLLSLSSSFVAHAVNSVWRLSRLALRIAAYPTHSSALWTTLFGVPRTSVKHFKRMASLSAPTRKQLVASTGEI